MKSFKLAVVAALSSLAVSAFALAPMQDADLSDVSGQDGVSIAAKLKINIDSFVYTDTDAAGGSISFNNIDVTGAVAATIDIINNATFLTEASAQNPASTLKVTGGTGLADFQPKGDVVRIALPEVTVADNLTIKVASMKMGNADASFGSVAMNQIKMQGTVAYIWAH